MTNSASRWRKIAKNLPQDLIHYTITITWFLTDSHTKVTSPRTAREKAAQNLRLHFIQIRHCDECICRWVWSFAQLGCSRRSRNIFCNVAHTTVLKETSSLLRFHFQRRSLPCRSDLIQVARGPLGLPRILGFIVRPWRSERVKAVGFQSFLYEQRSKICFQSHQNTRAAQKLKLNGKCIRHSDVFVWNGVWVFAQLFSYPCAAMSLLYGNQLQITWLWSYIWLTYTM